MAKMFMVYGNPNRYYDYAVHITTFKKKKDAEDYIRGKPSSEGWRIEKHKIN